ncbi:putative papain-like cysteine peptidase superfamily [Helianthus anomalus]
MSKSGANITVKLVWINARCPRQPGGIECGYYVMKFMKEIAYERVEILDNDNVGKGIEEYSAADMMAFVNIGRLMQLTLFLSYKSFFGC